MNSTQGILNACMKKLSEITDKVNGLDVGYLPLMYGPKATDIVQLGTVYSERFFSCTNPTLEYLLDDEGRIKQDGQIVHEPVSADPAILGTLFDHLRLYKRPTPKQIQRYADMTEERFTAALVEIITGKGRGPIDADSMYWRCVYAGHIYLQVTEYLNIQTGTFALVPQSKTTNALARINTGDLDIDPRTRRGKIKVQDTYFEIAGYAGKLSTGALMLNDIFLHECRRTGSASISIPLTTLARIRGKSTTKPALDKLRAEIVAQMAELNSIYYRGRTKVGNEWKESGIIRICGGTAVIINSVIRWNFNQDFFINATSLAPMDYPRELWRVDPRTNQFYFGRYIAQNYRMNEGKAGRQRIRIKTLVDSTPNLPTYEKVMAGDRRVKDRIIRKTFKDLDALETVFYDAYTADGKRVDDIDSLDYETFINGYIEIDYSDYPSHTNRITAKQRREQKTKAAIERQQAKKAAAAATKNQK